MAIGRKIEELSRYIGYRFRDETLLKTALTHSSYVNECRKDDAVACNERLEFLGDSVLSLITSDFLYQKFPDLPEGDLTRIRAAVVCEDALASYARKIGLGDFLLLGKGERNNRGFEKPAVIADAFEATLAAIYLDAGSIAGIGVVADFLLPFIQEAVEHLPDAGGYHADSKSRLQEFAQFLQL